MKKLSNADIKNKIDKNRELIERFLVSDCDPNVIYGCVKQIEKNNNLLINQLKSKNNG